MLDKNNLAQLKQLKKQIIDQKEYACGIVKSTQRRFGFVVTNDGREIFLSPDEMLKVFPGDAVKVLLKTDDKGKVSGIIEKLESTTLSEFIGQYIVKGQGHFVQPDLPRFNRWIFIPGSTRKKAKAGDYIRCKISQHSFPAAKPQATILNIVGNSEKIGIEADYVTSKFQLEPSWPPHWQESILEVDYNQRVDLTNTPFVTIDAINTADLDDAVHATATETGWQLQVAIADPCAYIKINSPLEQTIAQRGTSIYLPGKNIPMLPAELANDLCSLRPDQEKAALVCTIQINTDGTIADYTITEAKIRSAAQLSYDQVAHFLTSGDDQDTQCAAHAETLKRLNQLSQAMREQRKKNHLVIEGRSDLQLILNAQKKLDHVELKQKNCAHILIEECMVAANQCAANMLGDNGLFITHAGFRKERIADVCKLAQEQLALTDIDVTNPQGYKTLMSAIDDSLEFPLRSVLSRLLERSQLSSNPSPHYGMGLPAYTTFTSPIRKYSDFLVHRLLKSKLTNNDPTGLIDQNTLDTLQRTLATARQAQHQMEQWLKCQFMSAQVGKQYSGIVSQINSNGFTVRLDEHLIEGFIETKLLTEKYSFDPMRLRLSSKSQTIELDQAIDIVVKAVDITERSISLTLPIQTTTDT